MTPLLRRACNEYIDFGVLLRRTVANGMPDSSGEFSQLMQLMEATAPFLMMSIKAATTMLMTSLMLSSSTTLLDC
jgi:hypothetical protein